MAEQDKTKNNRSIELCRRTVTTESFIEEAKAIYGDRYDYSNVVYKNSEHRVAVTCPVHGNFLVYAREHLDGKGCPKCEKGDKFLTKLREKFGDRFGLSGFVYHDSKTPVTLVCPEHGAFSNLPNTILNSRHGCPQCGYEQMLYFQEQARIVAIKREEEEKQRQKEADKEAKEEAAYYWHEKIYNILNGDLSQNDFWDLDFFGFNLHDMRKDDGEIINGRVNIPLDYSHYPFQNAEIQADNGDLVRLSLFLSNYDNPDLDSELLAEVLYVCGSILYRGYSISFEKLKEKCNFDDDHIYSFEGVLDGYKFQIIKRNASVDIRVKKTNVKTPVVRNYQRYEIKDLPKSFVGIDFEILYPQRFTVCSVGMAKYIDGVLVDKYYSLVKPPFDYPGKSGNALTWIHGITAEMLKDAKPFPDILPEMERFVDGLPLVAHNRSMEKACIEATCEFYGLETKLDYCNIFDTIRLSRQAEEKCGILEKGSGSHTLDAVCERFGICCNNHHNALADAEMCGNLMAKIVTVLDGRETVELKKTTPKTYTPRQKYNPEDMVQRKDIESITDNPFKNQVVVLSGFSSSDSQEYGHKLNELGAIIKNSVSGKTNILITGYNAGPSKMQKAQDLGIRIMPEKEFLEIIKQL